jgi:hypothetical protein
MKARTIKVNISWLESLARLAKQAEESDRSGLESIQSVTAIAQLIGFASSAKTLLKYGGKE